MGFLYKDIEYKRDRDAAEFEKFGPRCWTCRKGVNFSVGEYPYALNKDVTYCKRWGDLMETPDEPSEELVECWEG